MSRNTGRDSHVLQPKHAQAASLMAAGSTNKEIATLVSVDESTICRWRDRDDIAREVTRHQAHMAKGLRARLTNAADKAVSCIVSIMEDEEVDPAVRLQAAEAVLNRVLDSTQVLAGSVHLHQHQHQTPAEAKATVREIRAKEST